MSGKGKGRVNVNPEDGTIQMEEEEEEDVSGFEHDRGGGSGAGPLPGEQGPTVVPAAAPVAEPSHPGEGKGKEGNGAGDATGKEGEGCGSGEGSPGGDGGKKEGHGEAGAGAPWSGSNGENASEATKRALDEEHQPAVERQKKMRKKLNKCLICLEEDDGLSRRLFQTDCCHLIAHEQCFEEWKAFHSRCFACARKTQTRRKDNRYLRNTVISSDADLEEDTAEERIINDSFEGWYVGAKKQFAQIREEERAEEERQSLACVLDVLAMEAKTNNGEARVSGGAQDEGRGGASAAGPLSSAFTKEQIAQQAALLAPCDDERIARELEEADRAQAEEFAQQAKKDEDLARELQRLDEAEAEEKAAADAIARTRRPRAKSKGSGGRSSHGARGGGEGGGSDAGKGSGCGAKKRGRLPAGGCRRSGSASLPPALAADGSGGAEMEGVEGTCTGGGGSRQSGSGGSGASKAASSSSSEKKDTRMKKRKTQQEEKDKKNERSETGDVNGGARRFLDSTGLTSDEESIGDDETQDADYVDPEEKREVRRKRVRSTPPRHGPRASSASATTSTSSPSASARTSDPIVRTASSLGVGGVGGVDVRPGRGGGATTENDGCRGDDDSILGGAARRTERRSEGGANGGGGETLVNGNGSVSTASSIGGSTPTVAVSDSAASSAAGRVASVSSRSARVAEESSHSDLGIDPDQKVEKEEDLRDPGRSEVIRAGSVGGQSGERKGAGGSPDGGVKDANGCEFSNANGSSQRSPTPDPGSPLKQTKNTKPRQSNGGGSANGGKGGSVSVKGSKSGSGSVNAGKGGSGSVNKGKGGSGSARHRNEETGTKRRPEAPGFASNAIRTKTTPKPGKTGKGGGSGTICGGGHHAVGGGVSERIVSGSARKPLVTPGVPPSSDNTKITTTKPCETGKSGETGTVGGGSSSRPSMTPGLASSTDNPETTVEHGKSVKGGEAGTVRGGSHGGGKGGSHSGRSRDEETGTRPPPETHSNDTSSGGSGERANRVVVHKQRPSDTDEAKSITKQDGGGGGNGSGGDTEDEFSLLPNNRGLAGGGGVEQAIGPGGGSKKKGDREIDEPLNTEDSDVILDDDPEDDICALNISVGGRAEGILSPNRAATPQVGPEVAAGVAFKPMASESTLALASKAATTAAVKTASRRRRVTGGKQPKKKKVQGGGADGAGGRGLRATAAAAARGGGGGGGGIGGGASSAAAAAAGGSLGAREKRGGRDELLCSDSDGAVDGRRQGDQGNSGIARALPADVEVFDLTMGDD
ncbi:unnamed protein product [Ectocarpus sp. 13 AM-2016]